MAIDYEEQCRRLTDEIKHLKKMLSERDAAVALAGYVEHIEVVDHGFDDVHTDFGMASAKVKKRPSSVRITMRVTETGSSLGELLGRDLVTISKAPKQVSIPLTPEERETFDRLAEEAVIPKTKEPDHPAAGTW